MLVDGAALGWHIAPQRGQRLLQPGSAVDHQELWPAQPALAKVVEHGAPSLAGFAAHVLDGPTAPSGHPHARRARPVTRSRSPCGRAGPAPPCHRGSSGRSVPRPASGHSRHPNRFSPSATPWSPCPCRPPRQRRRRAPGAPDACWCPKDRRPRSANWPAWFAAGKPAAPCSSIPSSCPPRCRAWPRHRDFHPAKGPQQRARSVTVPVASDTARAIILGIRLGLASIARGREHCLELTLDHRLDQFAHPLCKPASIGSNQSSRRWTAVSVF